MVPGTVYNYSIQPMDYHMNLGATTGFTVTTPAAGQVEPRQTRVRPNGAYYGALGENMDVLSGNLNFTLPLLRAKARGGWSAPISLSYNSMNWRKDTGGTWKLGYDVGYGFGSKLQAGSIVPTSSGGVSHYIFTDATGAEYNLDQNSGGV